MPIPTIPKTAVFHTCNKICVFQTRLFSEVTIEYAMPNVLPKMISMKPIDENVTMTFWVAGLCMTLNVLGR
jgi:hypothetical protein